MHLNVFARAPLLKQENFAGIHIFSTRETRCRYIAVHPARTQEKSDINSLYRSEQENVFTEVMMTVFAWFQLARWGARYLLYGK